jgi:histidine phosphotransferase ChpT
MNVAGILNAPIDWRVAELLAARLCHDLIGPVAAVGNGVELLGDDDAEFARDAIALVGDSARRANCRLQFYRFAYGFAGGGLTGPPPYQLAADFLSESSLACDYRAAARALPPEQQKLACNMLAIAAEPLIRGGRLILDAGTDGPELEAAGTGAGLLPEIQAALSLITPVAELTSRTVGAYFAGVLAEKLGCRIVANDYADGFRLVAAARDGGRAIS